MKYLISLAAGAILTGMLYFSPIFLLTPSPIIAEYWIREMMVIKKNIALNHKNKNKIIVLSGSNTLFSIDTNMISNAFNMPAINYGLMGGLPLETLFNEMIDVAQRGDIIILPLEPDSYCKEEIEGYREFEIRNAIAWNYPYWNKLNIFEKILSIRYMNPKFPLEIVEAEITKRFNPASIEPRLNALDDDLILKKFYDPDKNIDAQLYSIYNVDNLGNIANTNDNIYRGLPRRAEIDIKVCTKSLNKLISFNKLMEKRGVQIYFANTPFVQLDDLDYKKIEVSDSKFNKILSDIAPVLDERMDLIFPLPLFLNTELHLNSEGRTIRTNSLIKSLEKSLKNNK